MQSSYVYIHSKLVTVYKGSFPEVVNLEDSSDSPGHNVPTLYYASSSARSFCFLIFAGAGIQFVLGF